MISPVAANLFVASRVIFGLGGVDDIAQRPLGDRGDGCQHLVAHGGRPRVHHQDPLVARLHGDVGACPDQHPHIALHRKNLNFPRRGSAKFRRPRHAGLLRLRAKAGRPQQNDRCRGGDHA